MQRAREQWDDLIKDFPNQSFFLKAINKEEERSDLTEEYANRLKDVKQSIYKRLESYKNNPQKSVLLQSMVILSNITPFICQMTWHCLIVWVIDIVSTFATINHPCNFAT